MEGHYLNKTVIEYRVVVAKDGILPGLWVEWWELCAIADGKMYFRKKTVKRVERKLTKHEALFEEFWTKYPKKVGKKKVEQKFLNIPKGDLESLMVWFELHLKIWAKDIKLKNIKYIPNPETWLNQERWRDEVEIPAETLSYMRADQMRAKKQVEEEAEEEKRRADAQIRSAIDKKIEYLRNETPKEFEALEQSIRDDVSKKFPKLAESPTHLNKQCEVAMRMHIRNIYFHNKS